ncbi:glycosyltransferase family 2 protein [Candidatus Woesearchaeota archaeon]|nr:glycosyltransferase family 2 protein [Candidatus Woesearchaeota archaeon]
MSQTMLPLKELTVSIIIPCFNEEEGIPHLAAQLDPVIGELQKTCAVELIFVDDGSTDRTNALLHHHFGQRKNAKIIRHDVNKNLGAALRTGFQHASGTHIAMLDSDCTYEPKILLTLLGLLDEKTDIVTVSPYHPLGKVENVPGWRIFLSKSSSLLYKHLLGSGIYTHGAMVRAYKREVLENVHSEIHDFLYVSEILIKALLKGYKVTEVPATLRVRQFGASKMKLARTIKSHLGLMGKIILYKTFKREL